MNWTLAPHPRFSGCKGPLVLAILDGVGVGLGDESDAVALAATPTLDWLAAPGARCHLKAHGRAVGLPTDDDMGNSEVGHNALGSGRICDQGALLVDRAIESGSLFAGPVWTDLVKGAVKNERAMHFIGLLSDGNVHSHIKQLLALLKQAKSAGVKRLFVHPLLDGRDVDATSAQVYITQLEDVLSELSAGGVTAAIASGGGRMLTTMDRYEADWSIVERGYNAHVHGDARPFPSAMSAIETFREEQPGIGDQFLPAFAVTDSDGTPVGRMQDGDSVVFFNFRGDRAIEISMAFDDEVFSHFDRGRRPDVRYAGMMEYDGDAHVPKRFLVEPPAISETMGEVLARNRISQLAISETQKYGHVTYFWNGNRSGKFDDELETYIEIESDKNPFDQRPWMKAAEITDRLVDELRTGKHRMARVNYANGDMVGHTGSLAATVIAVETVDLQLARLAKVVAELDGVLLVTADHGNADEMYQHDKSGRVLRDSVSGAPVVKTSHTLHAVPMMIFDPNRENRYEVAPHSDEPGIANVTATCYELLGFTPPQGLLPSVLRFR